MLGTAVAGPVTVRAVLLLDSVLSSGVSGAAPNDQLTRQRQKDEYLFGAHLAPPPPPPRMARSAAARCPEEEAAAGGLDPGHTAKQLGGHSAKPGHLFPSPVLSSLSGGERI